MRKFFGILVVAILSSLVLSVSASAVETVDIQADYVDEYLLQAVFADAVNNHANVATIRVNRAIADGETKNLADMLGNIQNMWTYRAPETFNYTRGTSIQTISHGDSFDIRLLIGNGDGLDIETAYAQKQAAEAKAVEVYNSLVSDGVIPEGADDVVIARAALDWVCANVTYINDDADMCHTAYSAFFNGYAVCDGYTSAYNLILKAAGISCYGIKGWAGGCHEWTAAVINGDLVYIDATWCDVDAYDAVDLSYFCIEPNAMTDHTAYYI